MSKNKRIISNIRSTTNSEVYDGSKHLCNLGAGDIEYIPNFIKGAHVKEEIFKNMLTEVDFKQMFNFSNSDIEEIPRMISAQTDKTTHKSLIYRMPGCSESNIPTTNWTPTIKEIVDKTSEYLNEQLNHCVITLYRNENDSLAFHQDKELDLKEKSSIVSISFGAARPIVFQEINGKHKITINLQSGSLLVFGPKTNSRYRHSISKIFENVGPRISLSVRNITTYIEHNDLDEFRIIGKGDDYQTQNYPFIKSHDDCSLYSEEIKQKIEKIQFERKNELQQLIDKFNQL